MPKLWLPPKVWFHGSQSTSTGGASASTGMLWAICCWLAHHMPWVLITALGSLVEPLVNRNLAMVSGPVACIAASTAGVTGVASRSAKLVLARSGTAPAVSTTSRSVPTTAPIARP
jgi:hypothetical protein